MCSLSNEMQNVELFSAQRKMNLSNSSTIYMYYVILLPYAKYILLTFSTLVFMFDPIMEDEF